MGEKFSVDIEKLAGFGGGVEDLAGYLGKVQGLVDGEAGPKDGWVRFSISIPQFDIGSFDGDGVR
ncbi:hypothetical protein RA988_12685, partial [Mycobacteroides abscessus subsp. massiliense]